MSDQPLLGGGGAARGGMGSSGGPGSGELLQRRPSLTLKRSFGRDSARAMAPTAPLVGPHTRKVDKFVPLGGATEMQEPVLEGEARQWDEWLANPPRGVVVYCTAEKYDKPRLRQLLALRNEGEEISWRHEAIFTQYVDAEGVVYPQDKAAVCFFEYGCVVCWGLSPEQQSDVLRNVVKPCEIGKLSKVLFEKEEYGVRFDAAEAAHMQNDTLWLSPRDFEAGSNTRLSISHAVAQSTKLSYFEERINVTINKVMHVPQELAATGNISLPRRELAKMVGELFIQKCEVNLLSSVLDIPEFFWSEPDSCQTMYEAVCSYLDLSERTEVLNQRLLVLQDMLTMLRDEQNNVHGEKLEWVIIVLIVIEVVIGLFECGALIYNGR